MILNMKDLLQVARENGFAIPAFNISDYSMFNGIMEICEEKNAPVIIAIHPDELKHITSEMVKGILERVNNSKIPAVIHLDHGASIDQIINAIRTGFTSVMIDGSLLQYEDNVDICKKVCDLAHAVGVSVEGELGTIGNTDSTETTAPEDILYTNPIQARDFAERTGIDCLAVAIGTCHGIYPKDKVPKLRIDILDDIRKEVSIPLVLHGGSGIPEYQIKKAIERGHAKINVNTELQQQWTAAVRAKLNADAGVYDPRKIIKPGFDAIVKITKETMDIFGSTGKA